LRYKGGVRAHVYAALVLWLVALAGCGGDDEAAWDGPPDPSTDGIVAVDGFVQYAQDVDESWEGSPTAAAAEFLRLDEQAAAAHTTIDEQRTGEGTGPTKVLVTLDGLFDDSVRAQRWTLSFEQVDGTYRLTSAQWAQRCQPERGHQAFTPEACT
jgi:hypothetical protein